MSKEEREIIYTLERSIDTYIEGTKVTKVQLTTKQAEILLNLIYQLQEENLRYKNYEYNKALIEQNNNLKDRISELQKENEKLKFELLARERGEAEFEVLVDTLKEENEELKKTMEDK